MSADELLAELRSTTRAEHDRIEDVLRLTEPMSMARYAAVMIGFEAFLRVWEPRIHDALPARLQPWFDQRRRHRFASLDVEWLHRHAHVDATATLTAPKTAAAASLVLDDLADVLGSLYVIEGSALGGRVIGPHLKKTLGLDTGHGASYFNGFGEATGAMWRDFRILVSAEIGESSDSAARACLGARATFAAMIEVFEPLASGSRNDA